jgi:hypothetical protein
MFDPTAFDNMKVVIEGAIYDLDLSGEIVITDRNDYMNMAKMSRKFDICFQLPGKRTSAKIEMNSNLINLAAELSPTPESVRFAGCNLKLEFLFKSDGNRIDYQAIATLFSEIWGPSRKITQTVQLNPLFSEKKKHIITVGFERLIHEEQIDDLVDMTEYMITSLNSLEKLI